MRINGFSQKATEFLGECYVYALIDPRDDKVFYIGKGTGDRVFQHEQESEKNKKDEKEKLEKIREIQKSGNQVKRLIVNWGMTADEALKAEASLINLLNYIPDFSLTNIVSGHHVHEAMTAEEFEIQNGAVPLEAKDIKHNILVVKLNDLYEKGKTAQEIYDITRGYWSASLKTINHKSKKVDYVFGVYNHLIVGVYKPDEWYTVKDNDGKLPRPLTAAEYDKYKDRVYFVCHDHATLDSEGTAYLHKSIKIFAKKGVQTPFKYIYPDNT